MSFTHFCCVVHYILTQLPICLVGSNGIVWHFVVFAGVFFLNCEVNGCSNIGPVMNQVDWVVIFLPLFGEIKLQILVIQACLSEVNLVLLACDKWHSPSITRILLLLEVDSSIC